MSLNVVKAGLARTVKTGVDALMVLIVIISLAHATVLQDGRYSNVIITALLLPSKVAYSAGIFCGAHVQALHTFFEHEMFGCHLGI